MIFLHGVYWLIPLSFAFMATLNLSSLYGLLAISFQSINVRYITVIAFFIASLFVTGINNYT